jgi:hypothetical protein
MANGESLFSYKARTAKTPTPTPTKPRRSNAAINTQNKDKAKGPKPLTKAEQWLKNNPPNTMGIVDEVKSMLNPGNLTGANAITAAIKGDGMSPTKRITSGLSGVVQGLAFMVGGKKAASEITAATKAVETKIVNRYAIPAAKESAADAFVSASKGVDKAKSGGKIYEANTVAGTKTVASTKIATPAQTAARKENLFKNADRVSADAGKGAYSGAAQQILKDLQTAKNLAAKAAAAAAAGTIGYSKIKDKIKKK